MRSARRLTLPVAALVAAAALVALAGCVPSPSASRSATPSSTRTSTAPPPREPSTTAVPTPTASVSATPVTRTCGQLISPDTMYGYNPNFVALNTWTPTAGSAAAQAKANKGVACRWQNETSNDVIDLSVADLDAATIESLKNQAVGKSTMVPTYDGADEGYFSAANGAGTAIVFVSSYWIVLTSQQFAEPGDAQQLVASVITALS